MHHVSPPEKNKLVIEVNDHGTWSMVHGLKFSTLTSITKSKMLGGYRSIKFQKYAPCYR